MMETRIGATQDPALGLSAPGVMDPVLFMSSDVCAVMSSVYTHATVERCRAWDPGRSKACLWLCACKCSRRTQPERCHMLSTAGLRFRRSWSIL